MLIYWEQNASGLQAEDSDTEVEDEDYKFKNYRYRIMKMKNRWKILQSTQYWFWNYKWLMNPWIITTEVRDLGCRDLKMIYQGYQLNQQRYLPNHQGYLHNHHICCHNQ